MSNNLQLKTRTLILIGGLFAASFMLFSLHSAYAACTNVPVSGDYTVSSTCTFANDVDGADNGGITVATGATLTINAGQTIVWSPGSSLVINGSIAINSTGKLQQTYLWVIDSDNDGYPANTTMVAQDTAPAGGKRRKDITAFSYVTDSSGNNAMKIDNNDSDSNVHPGTTCNGDCSVNADDGTCVAVAAGENGLPACQRCDGTNLTHVNISTFADSEGTNTCAGTCAAYCDSGSCINTDTADGTCNTSDNTRVASGGDGACTAGTCEAACLANGESCSAGGDCCSGYCYTDADGDGYGVSTGSTVCQASASLGDDCYDSNANAYPGQTSYFSVDRGDGSFDYNCDGSSSTDSSSCKRRSCSLTGISKTCSDKNKCYVGSGASYSCGVTFTQYDCKCTYYRNSSCATTYKYITSSYFNNYGMVSNETHSVGSLTCKCR